MTIRDIFDRMDYGPAPESPGRALDWIAKHGGRFGHVIDGRFTAPGDTFASINPASGAELAQVTQGSSEDVARAVGVARRAQTAWAAQPGHTRARVLHALARMVHKHARLFAVLESLDTGKPLRESRDLDVPLVARHFYYHAGLAQILGEEQSRARPLGVCAAVIPWNFPLLMLAWKVAPALAAGNAVVLKPAEWTSLSALLFAELAHQAGLPRGLLNVVTGDGATGAALVAQKVDKVAFTGSTEVGRAIRVATAGSGKALTLELGGKSPFIVFDDADIDSAVEGLVDAIWFNGGQVCCAGSRLLVQEGVAGRVIEAVRTRMSGLRLGDPLDKCVDVGAIVHPEHRARIAAMVDACTEGETFRAPGALPEGCFYPPTLISGLSPANPLMQEEIFGPVLVASTFRTPTEAVEMANNTRYGLAASVWTENLNLGLDVAPRLKAGVVWVNATNLFDAAAAFGGMRESGFGREGGWEGLRAYLRFDVPRPPLRTGKPADQPVPSDGVDRTAKLFIGGKQARPDGGYALDVTAPRGRLIGHVGEGNRKDIRNAVEAARAAQAGWARTSGHARAQVLYYLAENLSARAEEFAARLAAQTGQTGQDAQVEVDTSVARLFGCAAWADKWDGAVKSVPIRGVALAMREPVGVIGIVAPDRAPLLGLVTLLGASAALGNACVIVPSRAAPLSATDFYQVLETSDVPGGVINIVTGAAAPLLSTLAGHGDVDALWHLGPSELRVEAERLSAGNLKRVWSPGEIDWAALPIRDVLEEASEIKTVWVPYGE